MPKPYRSSGVCRGSKSCNKKDSDISTMPLYQLRTELNKQPLLAVPNVFRVKFGFCITRNYSKKFLPLSKSKQEKWNENNGKFAF